MTAVHSVNEVREDLVNIPTRDDQAYALNDDSPDDFARIGALMAKSIGKNEITADYQAFEAAHIDVVLLRGERTGMGGDTPGTIMWRDLNESPAFWQRV